MIFPFKVNIHTDLEKYKTRIKNTLCSNAQNNNYKVKFFLKFLFIWYWGDFELTAENHQGKNYFERRHILTIAFIKKRKGLTSLNGINIVNILGHLFWFLLPFSFSIFDGDLLVSTLISLGIMIFAMLFTFDKDKLCSKLLVKNLYDNDKD